MLFLVTKMGFVHLYDIETATNLGSVRVSDSPIFISCPHSASGGILSINRNGKVVITKVNEAQVVPYVQRTTQNDELAIRIAAKSGLPGAEGFFNER